MSSDHKEHRTLMEQWQSRYEERYPEEACFVADGPLPRYSEAPVRVCAVLKEPAEDPSEFSPEYTDLLDVFQAAYDNEKLNGATGRVALWMAGLFGHVDGFFDSERRQVVGEIGPRLAFINLKKSCGGTRSSDREILSRASEDRELIRRQVDLLNPHLVLSCGSPAVWGSLTWLYGLDWNGPRVNGAQIASKSNRVFADLMHPSARGAYPKEQFEDLVRVRDDVLNRMPTNSII